MLQRGLTRLAKWDPVAVHGLFPRINGMIHGPNNGGLDGHAKGIITEAKEKTIGNLWDTLGFYAGSPYQREAPKCLETAIWEHYSSTDKFFHDLMPFLVHHAQQYKPPRVLEGGQTGAVTLTQAQCLSIVANSFLCQFIGRHSILHKRVVEEHPEWPSINMDWLHTMNSFEPWFDSSVAKLRMILQYFDIMLERHQNADNSISSNLVHFVRHGTPSQTEQRWLQSTKALSPVTIHPHHVSIDDVPNDGSVIKIDFANQFIGGGILDRGCVQEEITFAMCPELIVTRLICPRMQEYESIQVTGHERFSTCHGYGHDMKYVSAYKDETPTVDGTRLSHLAAIDALPLHYLAQVQIGKHAAAEQLTEAVNSIQFESSSITRELTKAYCGMDFQHPTTTPAPTTVCTGNWGCGSFGGNPALKSVIQWAAASEAGRELHYYPFGDSYMTSSFPSLVQQLSKTSTTVGELVGMLLNVNKQDKTEKASVTDFCLKY